MTSTIHMMILLTQMLQISRFFLQVLLQAVCHACQLAHSERVATPAGFSAILAIRAIPADRLH